MSNPRSDLISSPPTDDISQSSPETVANHPSTSTSAPPISAPGSNPVHSDEQTFDSLIALGDEQYDLYRQHPDATVLDLAIKHYRAAFDIGPSSGSTVDRIQPFFRLYHALLSRAQKAGGFDDRIVADGYIEKAIKFCPRDHHLWPVLLTLQATSYYQRSSRNGALADLELAISTYQDALAAFPERHPQRGHAQLEYALALQTRYTKLKGMDDLDLAIKQFQETLETCPADLLVAARKSLAFAVDLRYRERQDREDLDLAIRYYASVVDLLPPAQLDSLVVSMGYAVALRTRFRHKALMDDLSLAIQHFGTVVQRCPAGHLHHAKALVFYAELMIVRSEQRESLEDIELAISYLRKAVEVRSEGDLSRPSLLGYLGYALLTRFIHAGDAGDLEQAIELCYEAVSLHSSSNDEGRPHNLTILATTLYTRYQLQGDRTDVHKARTHFQAALDLCPENHPDRPGVLNSYARLLGGVSSEDGSNPDDLELCIQYFHEALAICFEPSRSAICTNLATVLLRRFRKQSDIADLDLAATLCETALKLRPEGHPHRPTTFLIHAKIMIARFTPNSPLADVKAALDTLDAARIAFPPSHPLLIETYQELSAAYLHQHSVTNESRDLDEAFDYRKKATEYSSGGSLSQFRAAMRWVEGAEKFGHPSVLLAYQTAIRLLDLHLVLKPSVGLRHDIIKKDALTVCADATSCALRNNDVVNAVEMFEQSRGLFWTHMSRLRTPLDKLRSTGELDQKLADEFESLSHQLEMPVSLTDDGPEGQRYRRLQRSWNATVDKIRAVEGFDHFLLPPSYDDLRAAACEGPVIILNASRHSCDAIVVLAHGAPVHIPFPEDSFMKILEMSSEFQTLMKLSRNNSPDSTLIERRLAGVLRHLWDNIVCDVVRVLEQQVPKNSRIWWCPTGVFTSLPLHAAGPYRANQPSLSDIYVSSYTPTLSALIRSRDRRDALPAEAKGYAGLETINHELELVRKLIPSGIRVTELSNVTATRGAALAALKTHSYAHLACHGMQEPDQPFDSHFAMFDGPLSLLDIVQTNLGQETEFAFLSACQTATGDKDAPDEVIHLAAALQFSGIRNVVGTMWSVDDSVVSHLIEAFYRFMIIADGGFDSSRAARALRAATRSVGDKVPFDQRIVFIHIGA
ncbi:hypothetical protein HYDPIDRAFT_28497 [Hydnomerulius pinastri MD-312]|uniref:CHAT domain-containing protein n=1 Tax=Hydnomerulius pinastri MD-312 TaxID=994086 RepID=A0A0C9W146_9AGAM|nr:hypothetical protein HYDPIDRAFT_28497 [Hydnomerulius pinastri MD-312]